MSEINLGINRFDKIRKTYRVRVSRSKHLPTKKTINHFLTLCFWLYACKLLNRLHINFAPCTVLHTPSQIHKDDTSSPFPTASPTQSHSGTNREIILDMQITSLPRTSTSCVTQANQMAGGRSYQTRNHFSTAFNIGAAPAHSQASGSVFWDTVSTRFSVYRVSRLLETIHISSMVFVDTSRPDMTLCGWQKNLNPVAS